jgi:integrase
MGRRKNGEAPQIRFHAHSGQARVRINGQVIYLGPYGSPEANAAYHRLLAEWHATSGNVVVPEAASTASRRQRRPAAAEPTASAPLASAPAGLTLAEVCVMWIADCEQRYTRKDGTQSSTIHECRMIVRALEANGGMPAAAFKAKALVAVQRRLVDQGRPRTTVNRIVKGIRRMFRWATVNEYVPDGLVHTLEAVEPLRPGQTDAPELEPVVDVPDPHVDQTLATMPRIPRDLARFIRLVGCRPGEACKIRPCDVDTTGPVWRWTLPKHKNSWRGHARVVLVGPKAQGVLRPYLNRRPEQYCFSPVESERERLRYLGRTEMRARLAMCKECYSVSSLRCAIKRAGKRAKVPAWTTMQLRHTAATEAREAFGLDAAQARLGHKSADITQVYASVSQKHAERVAIALG